MEAPLVIDYVTEGVGRARGYSFVTPADHLPPATRKLLWRAAMPRGTGWAGYIGARALKTLALPDGRIALAITTVTDRRDELGRAGLRRTEISLLARRDYRTTLQWRLAALPDAARDQAQAWLTPRLWARIVDKALPKVNHNAQIILTHPYTSAAAWLAVEALVLKIALARPMGLVARWGARPTFTTLALDYRGESRIVALPTALAARYRDRKDAFMLSLA